MKPNRYRDIEHFMCEQNVIFPPREFWRLTPLHTGEINGLPSSRGTLLATNGILCYIELDSDPSKLFLGHLDFFLPDKDDGKEFVRSVKRTKPPKPKSQLLDGLLEGLLNE